MVKKTHIPVILFLAAASLACATFGAQSDGGVAVPTQVEPPVPLVDETTDDPPIEPADNPGDEPDADSSRADDTADAGDGSGDADPPPSSDDDGTTDCVYDSYFVRDVTIPDGVQVDTGTPFTKTWRLRNSGTCAWSDVELFQIEGTTLQPTQGSVPVQLPNTAPGQEVDVSVTLILPEGTASGSEHMARFQLHGPDGVRFGTRPFVLVAARTTGSVPPPTLNPAILAEAIVDRDFDFLEQAMANPFVIGYWQSEGVSYSPAEAIGYLQRDLLSADAQVTYTLDESGFPSLGGTPLDFAFGPDLKTAGHVFSQGWEPDGNGEAILTLAEYSNGETYWHGMIYAGGGF